MQLREVLRIDVELDRPQNIVNVGDGRTEGITMIPFSGTCTGELFTGDILPNGVDTQIVLPDGKREISARYVMSGKDHTGQECWVYVENNGRVYPKGDDLYFMTAPTLKTNSKALDFFNHDRFCGEAFSRPEGPLIVIYHIE